MKISSSFFQALIFCIWLIFSVQVIAQKTEFYNDNDLKYRNALELFQKEKYSAAGKLFAEYIELEKGESLSKTNAEYFSALCAAELFHPDAEKKLVSFIENHPENTHAKLAYFQLGRIYYKQKKYRNAIDWFEKTDVYFLTNEEVAEYYFNLGYSYYSKKEMDKASKAFKEILNIESKYKTAANYYYGHVAYANNNYSTALAAFEKLKDSETFGPLVPYYIVQIYYEQGKYDDVISYGVPQLKNEKTQNSTDIKRLVAESYYRKGNYKDALFYLEDFRKNFPQPSREDYYQIGYCHYKLGNCDLAIVNFEKVVNVKDATAQNAYYHLGDCFIKSGNMQSARSSFQFASQMDFDKAIKEDALFNYAKLSYELNFQPVAVKSLTEYIKNYSGTKKADEANELLAQVYLTTKNYKDALAALEKISNKSERAKAAYQKVAYFRGIEFYNDGNKDKAIDLFTKAIVTNAEPNIQALAMYWKAESFYALNRFDDAVKQYRIFIFNPKSINSPKFNTANYGLGYAHFKQENYEEANSWFRKYIRNKSETDSRKYNDALIRIADGFFMQRDYVNAQSYYSDASSNNAAGSDYCLFQKGIILGIEGKMNDKIQVMQQLISKYPKSNYVDDAVYETGTAFFALNNNRKAEENFKTIIANYRESNYVKKAKLNIALIYYNEKEDNRALEMYKQVIKDYPATPEASEALTGVKNIYVNAGNPDAYFAYLKTVPFADISSGAQDTITYEAAEKRYMKGDFENAGKDFENYLSRFPEGSFALNALFYKSECDYRQKNFDKALTGYEAVIAKPKNIFTEKSLLKAAVINYEMKNYEAARDRYARLEETADYKDNIIAAQSGQMRCNYKTGKFNAAGIQAQKVLAQDKATAEQLNEAHLVYGKVLMESREFASALNEFKALSKITNSAMGAEAKYLTALISNLQNNYKESQKKCFEVINQVPAYDYWVAKSFILLADNYVALGDNFQAKHTLKSIMDNYEKNKDDEEDILETASQKYDAIIRKENEQSQREASDKQVLVNPLDTIDEN